MNKPYLIYTGCFIALIILFLPQWAFAFTAKKTPVGMMTFGYVSETERLDIVVWFPAKNSNRMVQYGGRKINASRTRFVLPGSYPILLLSHDVAGSRFDHHDIATALAEKGFIVIAPNHLSDDIINSDMVFSASGLYSRPRHLLRALEIVLSQPELAPYADDSRIGVIGVGYGSITALQVVGLVPDLGLIEEKCVTQKIADSFCAPWVFSRLQKAKENMQTIFEQEGLFAFTPNIALFAPDLISVIVPKRKNIEIKEIDGKLPFFSRFFSEKKEREGQASKNVEEKEIFAKVDTEGTLNADMELTTGRDAETNGAGEITATVTDGARADEAFEKEQSSFNPTLKNFIQNSYQITTFYGASNGNATSLLKTVVTPHYEGQRAEPKKIFIPSTPINLRQENPVYRRPAYERVIRSIALIAPAAGAVYQNITGSLPQSVAIIEAQKDELFPPLEYSVPLYTHLGAVGAETTVANQHSFLPHLLQLAQADHYSLFATCSDEMQESLEAICGRVSAKERTQIHEKRDTFLIDFFQTTLGTPGAEIPPTGFVAVEEIVAP